MASTNESILAEYKSGRMRMVGKMVEPDERKGLIYLKRCVEYKELHFCWKERKTEAEVELDVVAVPGQMEFRRVEECKTGRVYVLKFLESARRHFFWMQEPNPERDEDFCKRVNDLLADKTSSRGGGGSEDPRLNMPLQEEMQTTEMEQAEPEPEQSEQPERVPMLDLSWAFRTFGNSALGALLNSPLRLRALVAQLPVDEEDEASDLVEDSLTVEEHLRSPQFNEALTYFSLGLQSGAMAPALEPFALQTEALEAARAGDLERFLRVLHREAEKQKQTPPEEEEEQTKDLQ